MQRSVDLAWPWYLRVYALTEPVSILFAGIGMVRVGGHFANDVHVRWQGSVISGLPPNKTSSRITSACHSCLAYFSQLFVKGFFFLIQIPAFWSKSICNTNVPVPWPIICAVANMADFQVENTVEFRARNWGYPISPQGLCYCAECRARCHLWWYERPTD